MSIVSDFNVTNNEKEIQSRRDLIHLRLKSNKWNFLHIRLFLALTELSNKIF